MTTFSRMTLSIGLAAVVAFSAPVLAADKTDTGVRKEKRTVVISRDGDEPEVYTFDGDGDTPAKIQVKTVKRGFLGVALNDMTPELRTYFGVPDDVGVLVSRVDSDSPAGKAGIKVGDVITAIDGKKADSIVDVTRAVRTRKEGETAAIQVYRDRRMQTISVTMAERDKPQWEMGDVLALRGMGPEDFDVKVDPDAIRERVEALQKQYQSPEWQKKLRSYQDMEKRMQELEKKLQEMEKKLNDRSSLGSRPGETRG